MKRESIKKKILELLYCIEPDLYQLYVEGNESDQALQNISLADDLDLNILDVADLGMDVRRAFNIKIGEDITKCETVAELIDFVVTEIEKDAVK